MDFSNRKSLKRETPYVKLGWKMTLSKINGINCFGIKM